MYYRHRFPTEIISYAVWLYFTFPLSYRDVQKLLLYRGIEVSYETIRAWGKKFAQQFAKSLRYRRCSVKDKCHLDEVRVTINGAVFWLWRAVDADGNVLDILMQTQRDKGAAKRFMKKLLKQSGFTPRVLVTDKLRSYAAAKRELLLRVEHSQHKGLNNRAEASQQPTRLREHRMQRFKSSGQAQRFLAAFEMIRQHFHPKQHQLTAQEFRQIMHQRFQSWRQVTCVFPMHA